MVVLAALLSIQGVYGQPADALFGPDGYRIAHYRGPVPAPPAGVNRIAPEALAGLRPDIDVLLIDVLPAEGGHRDENGQWHLAVPRPSIPGAHWFPEVGRGVISPEMSRWFERGIAHLSKGKNNRMIVTFCLSDCWMSWNAARRLAASGYTNVWWLEEGTDGWREMGLPLVNIRPEGPISGD